MAETPALPPLVARLTAERGIPLLAETAAGDIANGGGEWLIFLPGHGQNHAETADVAVILPELLAVFGGRLKAAVAAPDLEKTLRRRLDGIALPALVAVRGHELLGSISRVRDWHEYVDAIRTMFDGDRIAAGSTAIQ
ncbi:hydrogenase [Zavarzinia compransoris]|uniref:Hydrogenase expression/formation protein n=1 Tax=Zavarzinia compransoris TaxID=1264899 RepID=A0A317E882_9PROT|nr:hydrogenase [Zavarzinia compransoris]PWR23149.1 hydrogenase [Zavarzinia compransoris]TDP46294.1 hydrogenase-1 operon protein HyaE [Zavarzinia compransoris]